MAIGDVVSKSNAKKTVKLTETMTTTNVVPTLATEGIPVYPTNQIVADDGHCYPTAAALTSTLVIDVAGTTPSFTLKLWGYVTAAAKWYPISTNAGGTAALAAAVTANYVERFADLGHFDRLYLQASAVSGTTPSLNAYLTASRTVSY